MERRRGGTEGEIGVGLGLVCLAEAELDLRQPEGKMRIQAAERTFSAEGRLSGHRFPAKIPFSEAGP
jgi:hypothetical protein